MNVNNNNWIATFNMEDYKKEIILYDIYYKTNYAENEVGPEYLNNYINRVTYYVNQYLTNLNNFHLYLVDCKKKKLIQLGTYQDEKKTPQTYPGLLLSLLSTMKFFPVIAVRCPLLEKTFEVLVFPLWKEKIHTHDDCIYDLLKEIFALWQERGEFGSSKILKLAKKNISDLTKWCNEQGNPIGCSPKLRQILWRLTPLFLQTLGFKFKEYNLDFDLKLNYAISYE
jgi:hypothetical protein